MLTGENVAWSYKESPVLSLADKGSPMASKALTDTMVKSAYAEGGRRLQVSDARCQGLELRVTEAGSKSFSFQYRSRRDGKVVRLTLGSYPDLSLADARIKAERYRHMIADGGDPRDEKREALAKGRAQGKTFDEVAGLYLEQYAKPNKTSWRNDQSYLRRPRAKWRKLPISVITDDHVAKLLDEIAAEAPVSANRTQSVIHTLFRWAREPGRKYVTINPVADMQRRGKESPKERVLDDKEIKKVWRALDNDKTPIDRSMALALKLILLTAARPGMVAGMIADELHDLDGKNPEWHLPASRMKNGKPFIVPLSPQAVAVIKEARPGPDEPVIFPSRFHRRASIARHSLSQAVIELIDQLGTAKWTPHDLRRTAATLARRHGVPRDHVGALLAHTKGDVTAVYDQYDMLKEKREAVRALAAAIGKIVKGGSSGA
jgi:integrase